jgi:hypothetical protein
MRWLSVDELVAVIVPKEALLLMPTPSQSSLAPQRPIGIVKNTEVLRLCGLWARRMSKGFYIHVRSLGQFA